ncbi:triose-phosphate transporter family-domain-containing protein [Dioszegia hungarica]|uniref:Triose-phosphate transporter family-domain-containing protein n=1 Tax=Dioszegia hungarica TaxID=4972 RepID=A0AA38H4D7_9TREE|nr:triose-phosphate transporter family-domain-containing protein [Dioszegia hungarica]KAI9633697.1 triose-phosphate transporter family-domain-containing protein [Dioszegia hungarica]
MTETLRNSYEEDLDEEHELREAARLMGQGEKGGQREAAAIPVSAGPQRVVIPAVIMIPVWIGLSGGVILLNKYIFTNLNFPYPVFMTAYHMLVATIGTRILQKLPFERLKAKRIQMDWTLWSRTILPLSLLFSASLILSNMAYVYLSVSFVQMLKAFIPIFTLIVQLAAGIQEYNHILFAVVVVTAFGCIIAAAGEIKFAFIGFVCQVAAVVVESIRLVLVQVILKDHKLDPLSSIAMYAPVCLGLISICLPFMEGAAPFHNLHRVGAPILIVNGMIAFCLNVAGVFLIDSAGSLVLTLSGVGKDVLLICLAWLMGSSITFVQTIGYSIAISGLMTFRLTGGSPNTPNGQRLVRFAQSVVALPVTALQAVLPASARSGPRGTGSLSSRYLALLGASMVMLVLGSLYYLTHPHVAPTFRFHYAPTIAEAPISPEPGT